MKSDNLEKFEAEMLKLGWKLDEVLADEESADGTSVVIMIYEYDKWAIWSMFDLIDRDLETYQVRVTSDVSYYDYNELVMKILSSTDNRYHSCKDVYWDLHGTVGSSVFIPNLSELIVEWANSIDVALWLQHRAESEGARFEQRVYACAWYGYTKYIEDKIAELHSQNKDKYGVLTMDMLHRALEIAESRKK